MEGINPTSNPIVPPVPPQKSWIAKNYLKLIGGIVALFLAIILIDSIVNPRNQELSPEEILKILVDEEWTLTEKRNGANFETAINFFIEEEQIIFEAPDEPEGPGRGIVQIDSQNLVLIYTSSSYDSTGKVIMETLDSGNTWKGKSNYPQYGETYNATLSKKASP